MPAYTRRPLAESKFVCRGMNMTLPADLLPAEKFGALLNVRSVIDGEITLRQGLTLIASGFDGATYLHSLMRVSDSNPSSPFVWFRLVGTNLGSLWLGQTTFSKLITGFSGNPLSLVPVRPVSEALGIVIVGDSAQMKELLFRPIDTTITGAKVYGVGLPPPNGIGGVGLPTPAAAGAGNLTGTYWWAFASRNIYTGKRSNPSAATRINATLDPNYGAEGLCTGLALTNQAASFQLPSTGPGSATLEDDTVVDIYRFGGTVFAWKLVGSGVPGDIFKDNTADIAILSAASPPLDAAGNFALVQPFATIDTFRSGILTFSGGAGANPAFITITQGVNPNDVPAGNFLQYPPGTEILVDPGYAIHLYRWSDQLLHAEILEGIPPGLSAGVPYPFKILAPALVGTPLPHIWGPFGLGSGGMFLFACGDTRNAGTLYWTNGNDPDSAAITNSLVVTDASEPLINGLVFHGRCYVWSSRRMFEVLPDIGIQGNFIVREVPGAGGLYAPWGVVEAGDYFFWIGYDGIYRSTGSGADSYTDVDILPWFRHEGVPPNAPFNRGGLMLQAGDPNHLEQWRLFWQDGMLYFDWPPVGG